MAIVHPIKAHLLCSGQRIRVAIAVIWLASLLCGLPTAAYNDVRRPTPEFPVALCTMMLPDNHRLYHDVVFKSLEFVVFFLVPVTVQMVLYAVIGQRLFVGGAQMYAASGRRRGARGRGALDRETDPHPIRARKGVVKMLIVTVLLYVLSFAPSQIPLFYDIVSQRPFKVNWSYLVLVITSAYVNSAANPIIYCIFSQKYRRRYGRVLLPRSCWRRAVPGPDSSRVRSTTLRMVTSTRAGLASCTTPGGSGVDRQAALLPLRCQRNSGPISVGDVTQL